jgi:hypothetical protein
VFRRQSSPSASAEKRVWALLCALGFFLGADAAFSAHLVSQTFELNPGWNAIFLEVQPPANDTDSVFRDVPISSVWTWVRRETPTEFFQNLSEELQNDPHWLVFFPTNRHEKMFNDLFLVSANRAYFIKLAGTSSVSWTVTGRPAVPKFTWNPNEFNLVGFPLDPAGALPTVADFFLLAPSLAGQAVYRLNASGAWQLVSDPGAESMRAGECLWVYADGESSYLGPAAVSVDMGDGLDYGASLTVQNVRIRNLSTTPANVTIRDVLSGSTGPLAYYTFDDTVTNFVWKDLPDPLAVQVTTGTTYRLELGVRRELFTGSTYETTIEVISDLGTRVRIPLSASQ